MMMLIEMRMTGVRTSFRGLESRVSLRRHSSKNDMHDLGVHKRSQTWKYNRRFTSSLMVILFLHHNHTTNHHHINATFVVSALGSVATDD